MSIQGVTEQNWIITLFVRDDDERLLLGVSPYEFTDSQEHFTADTLTSDVVEVQGGDGVLFAGQVRRASTQSFDGIVGDASFSKTATEALREDFITFFAKNHTYTVIYLFSDGYTIQRQRGYLVDYPEITDFYQLMPSYHVALGFEDVNYYRYAEDANGNEVYSGTAVLPLQSASSTGGWSWDTNGALWDSLGGVWDNGAEPPGAITTNSDDNVYPLWTVTGPATNPQVENTTTGVVMGYTGTVTATQTLVFDTQNKTFKLTGLAVVGNMTGNWLALAPGDNNLVYTADNSDAPNSLLEWQEVVAS